MKKFLGNTRRFLGHLDKAQRIQSLGIISLMFVVSAVELIGLGIIIPVAAILMDDSAYNSDGFLRDVWLSAGSPDRPTFTLIAVIAIVFT